MADESTKKFGKNTIENGNVILVEPNDVNINTDIVNGIPQYQDMHIFSELTAVSKGRTVIVKGNTTSTTSKKINFLGNDQNENNPNYLNFTTNYYDGSTGNNTHYEGFGINSIKIVINSSFIPQVDIQFVDVRGLAFFNQTDSPYRILFDFPPPIFHLTVKGYYGKSIKYQLHLVKYTSEFQSSNGNFVIDAQFVAVTFAPLSDILFRYIINAPLINNDESMSPSTAGRPKNTYNLIMKLKNLYAAISEKLETDTENKEFHSTEKQLETLDEISDMFTAVIERQNEVLEKPGRAYLIAKTPKSASEYNLVTSPATEVVEKYNLQIIRTLAEFNRFIKDEETTGIKSTLRNRLFVVYLAGTNLPLSPTEYNPFANVSVDPILAPFEFPSKNYSGFETALTSFRKALIANVLPSFNVGGSDIGQPAPFANGVNITNNEEVKTEYYGLDITDYYYKLYKKNQELVENKNELSANLAEKINNMVSQTLGMTPTIYNIFDIILNDVDEFFRILRTTSQLADDVHNTPASNKKIIAGNNIDSPVTSGNVPDHIYPFPLVLRESPVHGGLKRERIAPIELSKKVPFPELDLVTTFMDTFGDQRATQALFDARRNQDDDGVYKWIPTSPLDSKLGGASPQSPYLNINDDVRAELTKIFLKRFYMLSQGSIDNVFYGEAGTKRDAYINLYANAEAINVATTLFSKQNADTLKIMADSYKGDVQAFYDYAETIIDEYDNGSEIVSNNLIDFPINDPKYFPITPSNPSDGEVYVNKFNDNFVGFNWYTSDVVIQERSETAGSSKPVDNFNEDAKTKWFKRNDEEYLFFEFTQENVIYLRDVNAEDVSEGFFGSEVIDGLNMFTRYLTNGGDQFRQTETQYVSSSSAPNGNYPGTSTDLDTRAIEGQKIAYAQGNQSFRNTNVRDKKALKYGNKIFNVWINQLGNSDVVNTLTGDTTQNLSTVLILSNFGTTASPFNIYPNASNTLIFDTPAAIQVPEFYAPYIGALLTAIDDGWENEILGFFTGTTGNDGIGANFPNKGFMVLADLHDVETYLSNNDKAKFKQAYNDYLLGTYTNSHGTIVTGIKNMCDFVRENSGQDKMFLSEGAGYTYVLNPQSDDRKGAEQHGQYYWIIQTLMESKTLVNFSQLTFEMSDTYNAGYTPLSVLNEDTAKNDVNEKFLQIFFGRLSREIINRDKELKEEEEVIRKVRGDEDIITQLYYSFKNINDKWLTGSVSTNEYYPFNKPNKRLIDSFAFVDRGMNPIGDTVINAEILIDMMDNPNISLFSVLSQLLSLNGFEFFPLQNFMSFENETSWEDSFKIHTGAIEAQNSTAFVCMYIGGTSSYPSVAGNGFVNDGIIDITEPGVTDYFTSKPDPQGTVNDKLEENTDFPWRQVRAFRVRFGEQNQSMFTDIKIDSKEYPETNESIQILSRLAGDNNPDAPVPKGQNLYNLYENRSYKATVTGFGNAMIQPTQYFQLENIPLFNGAYIILTVEHNITANKMTTSFSGTKLLKYPVPRVLNPVAFTAYRPNQTPGEVVISAANFVSQREETHFDAMYDKTTNSLKIE